MHYLLIYEFVADYLERRPQFRDAHLRAAWAANDRGELLLAGAFAEPADGAMLVFSADSPAVPERFAREDPYVQQGLVTKWQIRPWTTVVGAMATTPVKPD